MEETKRVGFINKSATGLWGTLTWDETKFYLRNVKRVSEGRLVADIQQDTGETFLNKANKVCKRYKTVGAVVVRPIDGEMVLNFNGQTVKESFEVSQHSGQNGDYMRLSFSEPNPYLADLLNDQAVDTQPVEEPAVESVPDEMPF